MTGAWWTLLAITLVWWFAGAGAVWLAWQYALRTRTLYQGLAADAARGRPAATAEVAVIADALKCERHRHARPARARPRLPRIRLRRRDPFPELPQDTDPGHDDTVAWLDGRYLPAPAEVLALPPPSPACPFCKAAECARCGGCICPRVARCECTQTAITAIGGSR